MKLKDIEDRIARAVETENPRGTDYYGAEVDEDEVAAARERIDRTIQTHEEAAAGTNTHITPESGTKTP